MITRCRVCDNSDLVTVLDLGEQVLTGIFPRRPDEPVPTMPLALVKCVEDCGGCGLVQLRDTGDLGLMYGEHYGYRSGLNRSTVEHLRRKVDTVLQMVDVGPGDLVLDIGSNDSTLLRQYPRTGATFVGIDPTGRKFHSWYPSDVTLIPEFFRRELITDRFGGRRAKVVTSIAMFYDLPRPMDFMRDVYDVLSDDGVWMLEQSYLPDMLDTTSYDTVCHEHLEYYALRQIEWMAERVGFVIRKVELNGMNGGSFCLTLARRDGRHPADEAGVAALRRREEAMGLSTAAPYEAFTRRVAEHREALNGFLAGSAAAGRLTLGWGASTKGNVILQYCGITPAQLPAIAEVNDDKLGRFTPGTGIPIVSEAEVRSRRPDQLLVLPWHFRDFFIEREHAFRAAGGKLVFPLPRLSLV